jgi:putative nucleotidyltransferase with HDIG domain
MRMRNPAMLEYLPSTGTDGKASVSPIRGSFNRPNGPPLDLKVRAWSKSVERRTIVWIAFLLAVCTATTCALITEGFPLPAWWEFLALALVTAGAERQSVRLGRNVETSVAFLPFVFTAVAFGPLAALAVGVLANALDFRRPYLRWAIYIPARGLTGAFIGLIASHVITPHASFGRATLATMAAGVANLLFDSLVNVGTLLVRRSAPISVYTRSVGPLNLLSLPLYVPLVGLMTFGYQHYSFWTAAMFLGPTLALQRVVHLYQRQRDVSEELVQANERLEAANISFATALVTTLDARDRYTAGHSALVAKYARGIAERLGLSEEEQRLAHLCGLVHDIGKIGLPPGLLEKPGPLSLEERRQMEQHPVIGERILAKVDDYTEIARVVRHHHERVDGEGYPDGLAGEEIPLLSRIISVADAYDAMTSDRPYRGPMPSRLARQRLAQAVGTQFDAQVILAFEASLTADSVTVESEAITEIARQQSAHRLPMQAKVHAL